MQSTYSPWNTYHGSSSLDGWAEGDVPQDLVMRWRLQTDAPIQTTPVATEGRIYVANTKGDLHALDMNGSEIWARTFTQAAVQGRPPTEMAFDAPLAAFESTLVACSAAGTVYALNAATGETRWETSIGGPIVGTPNFAVLHSETGEQERLFVIDQSQGALHALDFVTGAPVWQSQGVSRCDGSAAVNTETAVFGSCAAAVHVFSTRTGKLIHEIPIDEDSQVAGGVALVGDSVFAGSRSGKLIHANVQTGAMVWVNHDCEGESFSTPAVHGDWVVFGANDATLYALDRATGVLKWRADLGETPSSVVLVRDKALVSARGTLHLLRLSDGQRLWSYAVSDEITSPAVVGTLIVVGADDGSVVAFGPKQGG